MTLDTCLRLKKHYEDIVNGVIPQPFGHRNWSLVKERAAEALAEMEARIAKKSKRPEYANHPYNAKATSKTTAPSTTKTSTSA